MHGWRSEQENKQETSHFPPGGLQRARFEYFGIVSGVIIIKSVAYIPRGHGGQDDENGQPAAVSYGDSGPNRTSDQEKHDNPKG